MQIEKVINNNVVSAYDTQGKEIIIMGKGIGFHKKKGNEINEDYIEKIFYLENQSAVDRFRDLLRDMPLEYIKVSDEIITYTGEVLYNKLNPNIYITLMDHISFAIERYRQGMLFPNPLLYDVQSLYRKEYLIGEYAVALIHKKIGVRLPEDEAASIALHIVNAEYNAQMNETLNITRIIPDILQMVQNEFAVKIDLQSIHHEMFVTQLKYLVPRITNSQKLNTSDMEFCDMVKKMYTKEYQCSVKIGNYLKNNYKDAVSEDELALLTINIRRLLQRTGVKE